MNTIKKLTDELIEAIDKAGSKETLYWDNGLTSLKHVQRMEKLGVIVPAGVVEYLSKPEVPEILTETATRNDPAIDQYGFKYFSHNGKFYYDTILLEVAGSKNATDSYLRGPANMIINHVTGTIFNSGALIEACKINRQNTEAGNKIQICQSNTNGGNIEILAEMEFKYFNNRFAIMAQPIQVAPGKRLFYKMSAGNSSNIQLRLFYREAREI